MAVTTRSFSFRLDKTLLTVRVRSNMPAPLLLVAALLWFVPWACADGGTLRLSQKRGDLRVSVFTSPTPVRAGVVDISVLVQEERSGQPLADEPVEIRAMIRDIEMPFVVVARGDAATNTLLRCASVSMERAGTWRVEVEVRQEVFAFEMDVAKAAAPWIELGPWIFWPVAAIGVFMLYRKLGS